jgi:hypothetical protein
LLCLDDILRLLLRSSDVRALKGENCAREVINSSKQEQ